MGKACADLQRSSLKRKAGSAFLLSLASHDMAETAFGGHQGLSTSSSDSWECRGSYGTPSCFHERHSRRRRPVAFVLRAQGLQLMTLPSPHFSPAFYCGGGSGHVYCVALGRAPRRTVEYACGALLSRALYPCRLHRLATKSGEKSGLARVSGSDFTAPGHP
jgi:hypothetical protein